MDGHHRHAICQRHGIPYRTEAVSLADREAAAVWVLRHQAARRNLTDDQRAMMAEELRRRLSAIAMSEQRRQARAGAADMQPITERSTDGLHASCNPSVDDNGRQPVNSRTEAADAMGVSRRKVEQSKVVLDADPELAEKVKAGEMDLSKAVKEVRRREREEEREEIAAKVKVLPPSERWRIIEADVAKWQTEERYEFIITDPPYPQEYLPLYEVLAERAVEWLAPGGLLIAMCGQSYLDQIIASMSRHLSYYWCAAYLTPGQPKPLRQRQVNTVWKPMLCFIRPGDTYAGKIFGDVWKSDGNDKSLHKWGQSESGMMAVIQQVCLPGQSILDPFCGAGTTGVAALQHGCTFCGLDIDPECVATATARLHGLPL